MKRVIVRVGIKRSCPDIYVILEDAEKNPKWLPAMSSCKWITPPPIGVGSRYEQVARFLGKEIHTRFEVTAREPGRLITIQSREGSSFPLTVTRQVEAQDDNHCLVTEMVDSDPGGFYRIASPLLHAMVQRSIRRSYRRLRDLMEAGRL
jgi:uncharacterized membrane protein